MLRKDVDKNHTWDTSIIFADDQAWQKEYEKLLSEIDQILSYKSILAQSAQNIYDCLQVKEELSNKCQKIYMFANLRFHEDTTNTFYQSYVDKADYLIMKFKENSSFINTELLQIPNDTILQYLKQDTKLEHYNIFIKELFREKNHFLSEELEKLLASSADISNTSDSIFSMLNNADMRFEEIIDENSKKVKLTHGNFISFMESTNPEIRKEAFKKYYKQYSKLKNTFASTLSYSIKKDLFYAKARKYNSSIDKALFNYNIDKSVYTNLIETVSKNTKLMHKYIDIRKKRLKLDQIHMYDLYTPIIENINTKISFEDAKKNVIKSLEFFPQEYIQKVEEAFSNRWIDIYENEGKRSGAYSWGSYGMHPFILLNYTNKVNDMFTLTHEIGHAMHSYFSSKTQKYTYASYSIFVAEVASTVNEVLLMEHLLKTTQDQKFKQYLINYYLEQFRGTFFRQTMFAEFEMIIHDMVMKNIPLTSESLCDVYKNLNIKYYGENIIIDDEICLEWARIPHFYNSFYVYQYATGYASAITISQKILKNEDNYIEKYLEFLKSGSIDYPIELLKKLGIDMTTKEPLEDALGIFDKLLNLIETF